MTQRDDTTLADDMLERIQQAETQGVPIAVARGPRFEQNVKRAFQGLRFHQSQLCRKLRELERSDRIVVVKTGEEVVEVYGTRTTRQYPVVQFVTKQASSSVA